MKKKPEPTRENIIEFLKKNGGLVSAAMKEFGVGEQWIVRIAKESGVDVITSAEQRRQETKQKIKNEYEKGNCSLEGLAQKFPELSRTTINLYLQSSGLPSAKSSEIQRRNGREMQFRALFYWLSGMSQSEIAKELTASRQLIHQIIDAAQKAGLEKFRQAKKQK